MAGKERESAILAYLDGHRTATVRELCEAVFVSEATMRRELSRLHGEGKLHRTHGGAMRRRPQGENLPLSLREREHSDAKALIGQKCLSLIPDGATVMVDASSTGLALLQALAARPSLVLLTNSAKAPLLLAESGVKLLVTGGELQHGSYAYVGSYAEEFIRSHHADLCFFSVRTLTADGRLTDNALAENAVRRAMIASSDKSILMLDSKKLGAPCLSTLCHLRDVTHVVSERDISGEFISYHEKFI